MFVLIWVATCSKLSAQDEIVRVSTELVNIPVSVTDRDGRNVSGLTKEQFSIFENGLKQEISYFELTETPITVLLLLDISGSMTLYLNDLTDAANVFVRQLRPSDSIIVLTFSEQVNTLVQPTFVKDLGTGIKIKQKWGEGDTFLYDAVGRALKKISKVKGKKSIVLLSDGAGTGITSREKTIRMAEEGEALIYTVQYARHVLRPRGVSRVLFQKRADEIDSYMPELAQKTGGRSYKIADIKDLSVTFGQIVAELGQQYSVGYYPTNAGKNGERRKITVKVNVPNVAVHSRTEVVYTKPKK